VHAYADDLQVYGHANATLSAQLLTQVADCIARVEVWMARNRLRLNSSSAAVHADTMIKPYQVVRDLGVIVDGALSLTAHVTSVCFLHLH